MSSSVFLKEFEHKQSLQQPSKTLDNSYDEDHRVSSYRKKRANIYLLPACANINSLLAGNG